MLIIPMDWTWHILGMDFKPWRLYVVMNSFMNLFTGVIFIFLPESPIFLLSMNHKEQAIRVLQQVYASNTGLPKEVIPSEHKHWINKKN